MAYTKTFNHVKVGADVIYSGSNVFEILAIVKNKIKSSNGAAEAKEWLEAAMKSGSYEDVLQFCEDTVTVG